MTESPLLLEGFLFALFISTAWVITLLAILILTFLDGLNNAETKGDAPASNPTKRAD